MALPTNLVRRSLAGPARRALCTAQPSIGKVVAVGLGNMGAPLSGMIASKYPTAVYDVNAEVAARHAEQWGSHALGSEDALREHTATADVVVTCLPNTNLTWVTLDAVRPALRRGTVWLDATSGRGEDA
eukprot:2666239-Prymnesium_polylepis.2